MKFSASAKRQQEKIARKAIIALFNAARKVVPGGGLEPPRTEVRRILSPLRLPVPPSRLRSGNHRLA
ncbi:hypothetical protein SBA7_300040 [Candidatus Sulfotelmatobacter sp. SbA7]|nr:hypothetical protein SBA7_300040 [Candidatus Sulfotelmatobacter sp. SbA7]